MAPFSSILIFSTGNIITTGRITTGRPNLEKSNLELINSLRQNFKEASTISPEPTAAADTPSSLKFAPWVEQKDETLYIPSLMKPTGLNEERTEYDITIKLFYLPGVPVSERCAHTREALDYVLRELCVLYIDLLIISFPNISFDAEDNSSETEPGGQEVEEWTQTYRTLENLYAEGKIRRIGLSEFGVARLAKLLPNTHVKPSVDQINVRDCCVVPKPLIYFAREQKIELLTHNDCTDILPPSSLNNLLREDGTILGAHGSTDPQWVVKYTAVIQDRGVVENKGYFAKAKMEHD